LKSNSSIARPLKRRNSAEVAHIREKGINATLIGRKGLREFHLTLEPLSGESIQSVVRRLHAFLSAHKAVLIKQEIFGLRSVAAEFLKHTQVLWKAITWPLLWLEGEPLNKTGVAGVHAFAVAGPEVQCFFLDGQSVATVFSDGYARHCILGGITSSADCEARSEQADEVFDLIQSQLFRARMNWKHVARTWLYLDRILNWYGELNDVRKDAFDRFEIYSQRMPASTGIGAANLTDSAIVAGAWAVEPLSHEASVLPVPSPLQCSARDYGSCFSRAIEITTPDLRRLFISGTASISREGITEFHGDFWKQTVRTFEVVDAILKSRSMCWKDVSRATAYLKHARDAAPFEQFLEFHSLHLPIVVTRADICRDDLLFELELDALAAPSRALKPQPHC
jgi:enamine deaminase RidA (YjgF/YER057c/UK114 family)